MAKKSKLTFIFCFLFLFILIAIGLSAFFLWPREPKVEVLSVIPSQNIVIDGNQATVMWTAVVQVENPNFIAIRFDKVHADIFYENLLIGTGEELMVAFAARSTSKLAFSFSTLLNESLINTSLIQKCLNSQNVKFDIKLFLDLKIINWVGKTIIRDEDYSFNCRIPNLETLLSV